MLGLHYNRKPLTGVFAKQVREAAWRAATRNYNERDLQAIKRQRELHEVHTVTWSFDNESL